MSRYTAADRGTCDCTCNRECGSAVAATELVADQAADQAADDSGQARRSFVVRWVIAMRGMDHLAQ
jgi:hypothetical protein